MKSEDCLVRWNDSRVVLQTFSGCKDWVSRTLSHYLGECVESHPLSRCFDSVAVLSNDLMICTSYNNPRVEIRRALSYVELL